MWQDCYEFKKYKLCLIFMALFSLFHQHHHIFKNIFFVFLLTLPNYTAFIMTKNRFAYFYFYLYFFLGPLNNFCQRWVLELKGTTFASSSNTQIMANFGNHMMMTLWSLFMAIISGCGIFLAALCFWPHLEEFSGLTAFKKLWFVEGVFRDFFF